MVMCYNIYKNDFKKTKKNYATIFFKYILIRIVFAHNRNSAQMEGIQLSKRGSLLNFTTSPGQTWVCPSTTLH